MQRAAVLLSALLLLGAAPARAGVVGPKYPATCADDSGTGTVTWSGPTNAQTSNDTRTSAALGVNANSHYLKCTNFGFTAGELPSGTVIAGILVEVEGQQNGQYIQIPTAHIVKGGTIQTTNRNNLTYWLTSTDSIRAIGNSTDLWGTAFASTDIAGASGFGVAISVKNVGVATRTAFIDSVRITVFTAGAGRIYMTGWDTGGAEDGNFSSASGAQRTVTTTVARTGRLGLKFTGSANTANDWCIEPPAPVIDAALANKAFARVYLMPPGATILSTVGQSVIVAYHLQCTDAPTCATKVPGCYALLTKTATGYQVQVKYHGQESTDIDFKAYDLPSTFGVSPVALSLGQDIEGGAVRCPLSINGTSVEDFYQTMGADHCTGSICDLRGVCVGTPAINAVSNYASFPAWNLGFDDLVVDNVREVGLGYVEPLFPNANGTNQVWSNNGSPQPCASGSCTTFTCVKDWACGVEDDCVGGSGTQRERASTGVDTWGMDDLSPALGSADVVRSVRAVAKMCASTGTAVDVNLRWRSGTTELASTPTTNVTNAVTSGAWVVDTRTANVTTTSPSFCTASGVPYACCTGSGTGTCWTEATVNSLELGYEKPFATGTGRATAVLVYADVQTPSPQADWNMQDTVGSDNELTILTGCDSISASTATGLCSGGACLTTTCTTSVDCSGRGVCKFGICLWSCETAADCTSACDQAATCSSADFMVNQLATRVPSITNLINCGSAGQPSHWWKYALPAILANPYGHSRDVGGTCGIVKGTWGECTGGGNVACRTDDDCDTGQTCTPNLPDVVVNLCGANEISIARYVLDGCGSSQRTCYFGCLGGPSALTNIWGDHMCPQAASSPTGFQATRFTCTTDAECAAHTTNGVPWTGSQCQFACAGQTDPAKPCADDIDCAACDDDQLRRCFRYNSCVSTDLSCTVNADCPTNETCNTTNHACVAPGRQTCDTPADCPDTSESCDPPPKSIYDHNWGDGPGGTSPCNTCQNLQCQTKTCTGGANAGAQCDNADQCASGNCGTTATKYCTVPCSAITCTLDSQCSVPGSGVGGLCDTGTNTCYACGDGGSIQPTTTALQRLVDSRLSRSLAYVAPDKWLSRVNQMNATIEATGARSIWAAYGLTFMLSTDNLINSLMFQKFRLEAHAVPNYIDAHTPARYLDNRVTGTSKDGSILNGDGGHDSPYGAGRLADAVAATLNGLYPVCSADTSTLCGYCEVGCAANVDCNPPVVGASPTPTPRTGACSSGHCGCSVDANCGAGCTCLDIDSTAGVDKRCVCEQVTQCPAGAGVTHRHRKRTDGLCVGKGTCTKERVPPLCTTTKARCTTSAECNGINKGDVCAADGVWVDCMANADCRDGGMYADPLCAGPLGTPTPTPAATTPTGLPVQKVCQQPTSTATATP